MAEEVRLYHGTRRGFSRGGYLMPRRFHGGAGTHAPLREGHAPGADAGDYVYFTTSEELAWVYAWHAEGRGKPKVLVVEPLDAVTRDPEHSRDMEAYRSTMARVVEVRTEPLVDEREAAAGWVDAS